MGESATDGRVIEEVDRTWWPIEWVLLTGDRRLVAAAVLLFAFALLVGLSVAGVLAVEDGDALTRLFTSLAGGNITLITIVITINQLILSRAFGTPDEFEDRIEEVIEYRQQVEEAADAPVAPVTPDAFLQFLASTIQRYATAFRETVTDLPDDRLRTDAVDYADRLIDQSEQIRETMAESTDDPFGILLTVVDVDLTIDFYTAERLRSTDGESLPASANDQLDDVVDLLEFVAAARQYFQTLYLHRQLALLSRKLLYTGVPAVIASIVAVWIYGQVPGATLSRPALDAAVTLCTLVALAPLAVFTANVFRIATISRRTASLMPFEIREESLL